MQLLLSTLLLLLAAWYVFIMIYFAFEPSALLKALIIPMLLILIVLYKTSIHSWGEFLIKRGKWFLLFWGTVFLQMLVLSTGGIESPLLILVYFFMIGLSFLFSFSTALLFLISSMAVFLGYLAISQDIVGFLMDNPRFSLLQIAALIPIIAVSYVISQQYRLKAKFLNILGVKLKTEEAIMERLNELIIITDPQLMILSVNDAVERTLQRSRSQLLNTPLFSTLLLKNKDGTVVDKNYFYPDGKTFQQMHTFLDDCMLINAAGKQKRLMMQVEPIEALDGTISQISFILSFKNLENTQQGLPVESIDRARGKYEAISENLRNKFIKINNIEDLQQIILMRTIENDIFTLQALENETFQTSSSSIDISQLSKKTVVREQDFAKLFQIPLTFTIDNFDRKTVEHLIAKNATISPEKLTLPFFTVECDVQRLELLVQKLLDLFVLLASTKPNGNVHMSIESVADSVHVKIVGTSPEITQTELPSLYVPYYDNLAEKTNLQAGSGLEGYLVNLLMKALGITIDLHYGEENEGTLTATFIINKNAPANLIK